MHRSPVKRRYYRISLVQNNGVDRGAGKRYDAVVAAADNRELPNQGSRSHTEILAGVALQPLNRLFPLRHPNAFYELVRDS